MDPTVSIEGRNGYLFETKNSDNYCFVPSEYVTSWKDGVAQLDELGYVQEGWSTRNMRWIYSDPNGRHLFPDRQRPVLNLDDPAVQNFMQRVSNRSSHPFPRGQ